MHLTKKADLKNFLVGELTHEGNNNHKTLMRTEIKIAKVDVGVRH